MDDRAFGDLLRELRIGAALSQEALAERARLSPGAISALERSIRRGPQAQTLSLLAEALQLGPEDRARLKAAADVARRRPVRGAPSAHDGARATPAVRTNLPNTPTSFHGREAELDHVRRLIETRRIVTLLGTGGVGKTRLAIEAARRHDATNAPADGVWFVDLAPIASADLVTGAISRVLGIRQEPATEPTLALQAALATKRLLLVLDNCEHLLDACARVAEAIVRTCAEVSIVATSREAMRIDGEAVLRVLPLPFEEDGAAGPALDLFVDRLVDADFSAYARLTPDQFLLASTICRRLDGVPLALELAAGRARDLPLSAIVDGLDERFALLSGGRRTAEPRQFTLHGMIDWSYELLEPGERDLFARLGLFAGAFTPEAAVAVCDDASTPVRDALAALIAKSLVTVVEDAGGRLRYRLLDSIREFALARLRESGGYDTYARRFAVYFCGRARAADAQYGRIPKGEFLSSVEPDLENFRAGLEWSLGSGNDTHLGADFAGMMGWIYRQTTLYAEGNVWAERALAYASELEPLVVGRLHMALSFSYFNLGGMTQALEAASAATAAYRAASAHSELAWSLTLEAYCSYRFCRFDDVRTKSIEAVALARAVNDAYRLAGALNALALGIPEDRPEERFAVLEESIACYHASGDHDAIVPRAQLAAAYFEAGNFAGAQSVGLDIIEISRRHRDRWTLSAALMNFAAYALAVDDVERARTAAREALELIRDLGKTLGLMGLLQHFASIAVRDGSFVRAARLAGASDALHRAFEFAREVTEARLYDRAIGELRTALGDDVLAARLEEGMNLPFEAAIAEALEAP